MKTTKIRLREALSEHFGPAHFQHLADTDSIFPAEAPAGEGRALGDPDDRYEALECVDREFGIFLPETVMQLNPTIENLAGLVDTLVASGDASAH